MREDDNRDTLLDSLDVQSSKLFCAQLAVDLSDELVGAGAELFSVVIKGSIGGALYHEHEDKFTGSTLYQAAIAFELLLKDVIQRAVETGKILENAAALVVSAPEIVEFVRLQMATSVRDEAIQRAERDIVEVAARVGTLEAGLAASTAAQASLAERNNEFAALASALKAKLDGLEAEVAAARSAADQTATLARIAELAKQIAATRQTVVNILNSVERGTEKNNAEMRRAAEATLGRVDAQAQRLTAMTQRMSRLEISVERLDAAKVAAEEQVEALAARIAESEASGVRVAEDVRTALEEAKAELVKATEKLSAATATATTAASTAVSAAADSASAAAAAAKTAAEVAAAAAAAKHEAGDQKELQLEGKVEGTLAARKKTSKLKNAAVAAHAVSVAEYNAAVSELALFKALRCKAPDERVGEFLVERDAAAKALSDLLDSPSSARLPTSEPNEGGASLAGEFAQEGPPMPAPEAEGAASVNPIDSATAEPPLSPAPSSPGSDGPSPIPTPARPATSFAPSKVAKQPAPVPARPGEVPGAPPR